MLTADLDEAAIRADERVRIADTMRRYAARLTAGPAIREFKTPVNRVRYTDADAAAIVPLLTAIAQSISTGCFEPEADWPVAGERP